MEDRETTNEPRWTLPRRTRMHGENLHVSSFVLVRNNTKDSIILLKAGPNYSVPFKRGKMLLPARILSFGENPRRVAESLVGEQISGIGNVTVDFVTMQSYLGAHWDIVFLFQTTVNSMDGLKAKPPFTELGFYKMSSLPIREIAADHVEVLDELMKEQQKQAMNR